MFQKNFGSGIKIENVFLEKSYEIMEDVIFSFIIFIKNRKF